MIVEPLSVDGAYCIAPEPRGDQRGFFARMFCSKIWAEHGLDPTIIQCNVSLTRKAGTIRGLHFQCSPYEEVKLVRCTQGKIFDVVLDLRPASSTFLRWDARELTADNHRMLYVPKGCAHGFQTLIDDSEVYYMVSTPFEPTADSGVRYDDPAFGIRWPLAVTDISEKDVSFPAFKA